MKEEITIIYFHTALTMIIHKYISSAVYTKEKISLLLQKIIQLNYVSYIGPMRDIQIKFMIN